MPHSKEYRLKYILGLHYTAVGQSHFTSLIDIVVISMRYAMNVHTPGNDAQRESALALLALLSPLFVRNNGKDEVSEFGLLFTPKVIKSARYRDTYQGLKDFTASYTVRHQATWETWAAKRGLKENRTRAEVAAAIRRPVEQAHRQALRPARWEQSRPSLRLVA